MCVVSTDLSIHTSPKASGRGFCIKEEVQIHNQILENRETGGASALFHTMCARPASVVSTKNVMCIREKPF